MNWVVSLEPKRVMTFFFDATVEKTAVISIITIVNYGKDMVVKVSWPFKIKQIRQLVQSKFVADEMLLLFIQLQ